MSEFMGPPSWWYDPPAGHSSECNCDKCHDLHIENGEVEANASGVDFQCCADELECWIQDGKWCPSHGGAYMDFEKRTCLECAEAAIRRAS